MLMNMTSYDVFMSFVVQNEEQTDSNCNKVKVDVSKLISKECYLCWKKTRAVCPKNPEESFRKALTSHCKATAGRRPFPKPVADAVKVELLKKRVWPCFIGTGINIGKRGMQIKEGTTKKRKFTFDSHHSFFDANKKVIPLSFPENKINNFELTEQDIDNTVRLAKKIKTGFDPAEDFLEVFEDYFGFSRC